MAKQQPEYHHVSILKEAYHLLNVKNYTNTAYADQITKTALPMPVIQILPRGSPATATATTETETTTRTDLVEHYLSLPISSSQVSDLTKAGILQPCTHGQGADNIMNSNVRNCLKIPGVHLDLSPHWNKAMQTIAQDAAQQMKIEGDVNIELHNLLVYPPDGHFKKHCDTYKRPGMFATMIVTLPSVHEGGDLKIYNPRCDQHNSFKKHSQGKKHVEQQSIKEGEEMSSEPEETQFINESTSKRNRRGRTRRRAEARRKANSGLPAPGKILGKMVKKTTTKTKLKTDVNKDNCLVLCDESDMTWSSSTLGTLDQTHIVVFFSNLFHELFPVKSGYRVVLVYNVCRTMKLSPTPSCYFSPDEKLRMTEFKTFVKHAIEIWPRFTPPLNDNNSSPSSHNDNDDGDYDDNNKCISSVQESLSDQRFVLWSFQHQYSRETSHEWSYEPRKSLHILDLLDRDKIVADILLKIPGVQLFIGMLSTSDSDRGNHRYSLYSVEPLLLNPHLHIQSQTDYENYVTQYGNLDRGYPPITHQLSWRQLSTPLKVDLNDIVGNPMSDVDGRGYNRHDNYYSDEGEPDGYRYQNLVLVIFYHKKDIMRIDQLTKQGQY
jgi:hypothetical protein